MSKSYAMTPAEVLNMEDPKKEAARRLFEMSEEYMREESRKLRKTCHHKWGFGPGRQDKEFCESCGWERVKQGGRVILSRTLQ